MLSDGPEITKRGLPIPWLSKHCSLYPLCCWKLYYIVSCFCWCWSKPYRTLGRIYLIHLTVSWKDGLLSSFLSVWTHEQLQKKTLLVVWKLNCFCSKPAELAAQACALGSRRSRVWGKVWEFSIRLRWQWFWVFRSSVVLFVIISPV